MKIISPECLQKKCNTPECLIAFFKIAFLALDVFRLEKSSRLFKYQIFSRFSRFPMHRPSLCIAESGI